VCVGPWTRPGRISLAMAGVPAGCLSFRGDSRGSAVVVAACWPTRRCSWPVVFFPCFSRCGRFWFIGSLAHVSVGGCLRHPSRHLLGQPISGTSPRVGGELPPERETRVLLASRQQRRERVLPGRSSLTESGGGDIPSRTMMGELSILAGELCERVALEVKS
jgi:hypothetical protein